MKQNKRFSLPAVGAGSLLAAFAVLCLTVFALLSIATVRSEQRLAETYVRSVSTYYAADLQAEEMFARLRRDEIPAEVTTQENLYTYQCPISENQYLSVALKKTDAGWEVLRWQAVAREMAGKEETLPVWNGSERKEELP